MAEKRVKTAFVSQRGKCLTALLKKDADAFALKCCKLLTTHGGGALAVAKREEGVGEEKMKEESNIYSKRFFVSKCRNAEELPFFS